MKDPASVLRAYAEQKEWLDSLITDRTGTRQPPPRSEAERLSDFRQVLSRTSRFLDFAGNPQDKFASIHVAGTSGKGSVVAFIAQILQESGIRTGHHVSPYMQVCTEKILLNGKRIAVTDFNELVRQFRLLYERWHAQDPPHNILRHPEAWTVLAFLWFHEAGVEWAVVETGVGGRFDPTNVLPARLAVITGVDYDHMDVLGPTLEDIARHKAGIIKSGRPAITGATNPQVVEILEAEANEQGSALIRVGRDFAYEIHGLDARGLELSIEAPYHSYRRLHVASPGLFQAENAALAVSAVDLLAAEHGWSLTEEAIRSALGSARIPGRMEVMQENPLVILDGAHNPHKMQSLADSLQRMYPHRRITAIVGVLLSKDAGTIFRRLLPVVSRVIVTKPHVLGKASLEPEQLARKLREMDPAMEVVTAVNVLDAIRVAQGLVSGDELVVITGSLYMLGEARNFWFPPETLLLEEQATGST